MNADAAADRAEDAYWRMLGERFLTENPRNGRKFVLRVCHGGSCLERFHSFLIKYPFIIVSRTQRSYQDAQYCMNTSPTAPFANITGLLSYLLIGCWTRTLTSSYAIYTKD